MELVSWGVALIVPLIITVALRQLDPPYDDFRLARGLVCSSALILWIYSIILGHSMPGSFVLRASVSAVVAAAVAVCLVFMLDKVTKHEAAASHASDPRTINNAAASGTTKSTVRTRSTVQAVDASRPAQIRLPVQKALPTPDHHLEKKHQYDNIVSLSCIRARLPSNTLDNKSVATLQIFGPGSGLGDVAVGSMPAGVDKINWGEEEEGVHYRCVLHNYGVIPLFGATVKMQIEWRELIKEDEGRYRAGAAVNQTAVVVGGFDIGTGLDAEAHFYIYSRSSTFVYAYLPTTFSARLSDGTGITDAKLIERSQPDLPLVFYVAEKYLGSKK